MSRPSHPPPQSECRRDYGHLNSVQIMLVDSHCHLDYDSLSEEIELVVARARSAGIGTMLTISTRLDRFPGVLAIAEHFEDIWCSVGVHPHEAGAESGVTTRQLIELSEHPKVVGIGESGLDYYYEHSTRELQQRSFRAHICAARELPAHHRSFPQCRGRHGTYLDRRIRRGAYPGLLHCFSATKQLAENALEIDFRISFSGIVTFKNAGEVATPPESSPWIDCWWRLMRPIWPRFRIGAKRTSHHLSSTPLPRSPS